MLFGDRWGSGPTLTGRSLRGTRWPSHRSPREMQRWLHPASGLRRRTDQEWRTRLGETRASFVVTGPSLNLPVGESQFDEQLLQLAVVAILIDLTP